MQHITNLAALDRELAGRVARFAAVTDTQFEPWHQPHFQRMDDIAPAPAEAATDLGADDEGDRSGDLPEGAGMIVAGAIVGAIAALAMAAHMLSGWFA